MKTFVIGSSLAVVSSFACQAFAFVEDESSASAVRYRESKKQETAFTLPAPGQKVMRSETATPKQESVNSALGQNLNIEIDTMGGDLRLVSGVLGASLQTSFGSNLDAWILAAAKSTKSKAQMGQHLSKALLSYVSAHQDTLKIAPTQLKWNPKKFFVDDESALATFDVVVEGILVEGSSVSFRYSKGQLVQIALRTFGAGQSDLARSAALIAKSSKFDPSLSLSKILGPSAKTVGQGKAVLFVQPNSSGKGYNFVPAYKFDASTSAGEPFSITQDITSTEVLQWFSQRSQFDTKVEAKVNIRTPLEGQETVTLPFLKIVTKTGGWFGRSKTFIGDEDGVVKGIVAKSAKVTLESKYFKITNSGGTNASIEANGNVLFDSSNSSLAEVTTLHHAEVVRQFVSSFIKDSWFESSLPINVNISDYCNAFWDGRSLNFFQAGTKKSRSGKLNNCNNTGEIADVVYHEYGHGIDANTGGIEDGAYSEGIGDITSMLITGSPKVGPGFFKEGGEVRNLEGEYQYPPTGDNAEVHKAGLIIGSTWYHLTLSLKDKYGEKEGQTKAASMFFKGLFTTSQYTDSYQATLALNSQGGSPDKAPDFCLINKSFARHGLAKAESRCAN